MLKKIEQLRPNEPTENLDWRKLAGGPITIDPWHRALSEIGGVLTNSTAGLFLHERALEYINGQHFDGTTLYKFFTRNYFERLINQPNGLTIAVPTAYSEAYMVPPLQHVSHENILYISEHVVAWISDIESEIEETLSEDMIKSNSGGRDSLCTSYTPKVTRNVKSGVYNIATKNYFIRAEKVNGEWAFDALPINCECLPAFQNGGLGYEVTKMKHVYFSFFWPAIPFGDMALNSLSDELSVRANAAFPHMWGIPEQCPGDGANSPCHKGFQYEENKEMGGDPIQKACPTCAPHGGQGQIFVIGPNKMHLKRLGDDSMGDTTPLGFVEANPANVKLTSEFTQSDLQHFREALCLYTKKGEGVESGLSIGLQMESTLALMRKIGPVVFGNLEKVISVYQSSITGSAMGAKVEQPIKYGIASEKNTLSMVFESFASDIPPVLRKEKVRVFLDNYVGGNSHVLKAVQLLELIDPFFYYSFTQKNILLDKGGMTLDQYNLSTQGFQAASLVIDQFPDVPVSELTELVLLSIISTAPEANTDTLEEIPPEQREAQARLRGSVGGVQGILAIQQGVASGTTDISAAIETLIKIYGFTREDSALVLGTPGTANPPINE